MDAKSNMDKRLIRADNVIVEKVKRFSRYIHHKPINKTEEQIEESINYENLELD